MDWNLVNEVQPWCSVSLVKKDMSPMNCKFGLGEIRIEIVH